MRVRLTAALCTLALLGAVGCGEDGGGATQAQQRPKVDPAKQARLMAIGKRVFAEHCHSCHGLLGKPHTKPVIEFEAPSFDDVKPKAAYVRERVIGGGIGMQSFQTELSEHEIDGIVAYVATVSGRGVDDEAADGADPEVLTRGESLFEQHCGRCHGIAGRPPAGRSQFPGTDFNDVKPSERLVIRRMHIGLEGAMPSYTRILAQPEFRAIAAYVTSIAAEEPPEEE
jgi:mono/diheme cytochrome c family protein